MNFLAKITQLNSTQEICEVIEPKETYSFGRIVKLSSQLKTTVDIYSSKVPKKVLVLTSNTLHWLIADQYCLHQKVTQICIPLSFTAEQVDSLLHNIDVIITDDIGYQQLQNWKKSGLNLRATQVLAFSIKKLSQLNPSKFTPASTCNSLKIIHTSGSTGNPKGVIISEEGLGAVVDSLNDRLPPKISERYLSIVPCSLLIEQVAIYLTLLRGGKIIISGNPKKLLGEGNILAKDFLTLIKKSHPTSMAIPPSVAKSFYDHGNSIGKSVNLVHSIFKQSTSPFITCGGAPIAPEILNYLQARNISIYQGYGLSENSSVVSVNAPGINKTGTVGLPLKHVQVKLSKEGELLIKSPSIFKGYVNSSSNPINEEGWLKTGDLASIDHEGYITIEGRMKKIIINSHGRNFNQEWLENQYKTLKEIDDISLKNDATELFSAEIVKNNKYSITDSIKSIRKLEKEVLINTSIGSYNFTDKINKVENSNSKTIIL